MSGFYPSYHERLSVLFVDPSTYRDISRPVEVSEEERANLRSGVLTVWGETNICEQAPVIVPDHPDLDRLLKERAR